MRAAVRVTLNHQQGVRAAVNPGETESEWWYPLQQWTAAVAVAMAVAMMVVVVALPDEQLNRMIPFRAQRPRIVSATIPFSSVVLH
jgi:hypothetical protein